MAIQNHQPPRGRRGAAPPPEQGSARPGEATGQAAAASSFSPARILVVFLLLVAAGLLAYLPSFQVPFLYDDLKEIVGNPALRDLSDLHSIVQYNPARALLMLTFALDLHFWGARPFAYHVENLLVHLGASLLVFALLERLLSGRGERPRGQGGLEAPSGFTPALVGTGIFLLHPLQVESVTYIASRSSSLATLFYLSAFLAYIGFREAQAAGETKRFALSRLGLSVGCYLLAVLTKEEGVSLPAVLLLYDGLLAPRPPGAPSGGMGRSWWLASLPFWGLLAALALGRLWFYGTLNPPVLVRSRLEQVATALEVLWVYLRLFLAPHGLSIYHDYPIVTHLARWQTWVAAVGHLTLLGAAIGWRHRFPRLAFGVGWYYVTLSPTTSVIPLKEVMAEHRMYLALFGPLLLVGGGLRALRERWKLPSLVLGAPLALGLGVLTWQSNRLWQNEITLWQRASLLSPHSGDAAFALGDAWRRRGRLQEAEDAYQQALVNYRAQRVDLSDIRYNYVDALNNLGLVYGQRGNLDLAISYFRRAINANGRYVQAWTNLGYTQMLKGLYFEASLALEEALSLDPDSFTAHHHLGEIYYLHRPDSDKAAFHTRRCLELRPGDPRADELRARLLELGFR